jgi:hypothetical protein
VHRFAALALSLAIPVAALAAPLLHVHPDEHATAHHRGATVHSHWSGHSGTPAAGHSHDADHDADHDANRGRASTTSDGPALDAVDRDRAVFFSAYVAVTPSVLPAPGIVPNAVALPVPLERAAHLSVQVAHGHDPPLTRLLPARAPPSFLS